MFNQLSGLKAYLNISASQMVINFRMPKLTREQYDRIISQTAARLYRLGLKDWRLDDQMTPEPRITNRLQGIRSRPAM